MPCRLREEDVVTITNLAGHGVSNREIARQLGIAEGTVRYHLRRRAQGAVDGRSDKPFQVDPWAAVIEQWYQEHRQRQESSKQQRPVNIRELYEHLVAEWGYQGSYNSVRRYCRSRYPVPKIRTYRRVETPPGAQAQTDWAHYPRVDVGEGPQPMSLFIMGLSHSRMPAMVWSPVQNQLAWLRCHNESFMRLGGIPATNRIDNVKTAIAYGAGSWGQIHPVYRSYARAVGFHIDACQPAQPQAKGKVEAKVRLSRLRVDPTRRRWDGQEELQALTDERIDRWARQATCPATGLSIYESWQQELDHLRALPILPEPFDVAVNRPVHRDCRVQFEGRSYPVPFNYVGQMVEVRGCDGTVQILAEGKVIRTYPRHTPERILIDPSCYEGEPTDRVMPPPPLGRMGRRL